MTNKQEHPLIAAIRLKKIAIKNKADDKILSRIDKIIDDRASEIAKILYVDGGKYLDYVNRELYGKK